MKDYSQYGETKIVVDAVKKIEDNGFRVPRVACEFGAGDGFNYSNIRGLMEDGWNGFQIEKEYSVNRDVARIDITAENVNDILKTYRDAIGVISIDVDGNDYWIWMAMTFDPCIVIIEFNPTISGHKTIKYNPTHRWTGDDNYFGASFKAMLDLGHSKGYKAIAKTECNLIFVRADLWLDPEPELTHEPKFIWTEKEWQDV